MNPCIPARWRDSLEYLVSWAFANRCRSRCPYCFAVPAGTDEYRYERQWTEEQAIKGFENLYNEHGPICIFFGGLEPGEELPLVAKVLQWHYGVMQSNFMFEPADLIGLVDPARLILHPTFHPHLWDFDLEVFLDKRVSPLQAAGFEVELVAAVGTPEALPYFAQWSECLKGLGIYPNFASLRLQNYNGRKFPDEYTEEERALLNPVMPTVFAAQHIKQPVGRLCAAGMNTCCIGESGKVLRCSKAPMPQDYNFMEEGTIHWLDEPLPCPLEQCLCPHLHVLHRS